MTVTITLDGKPVKVPKGSSILQAAQAAGVAIPTLCHNEGCEAETSCLVCVVRVNESDRLLPACATLVSDGMRVESETAQVLAARRMALELLLSDHAGDCVAPCQMACPAGMDIPQMLRLIREGRMDEAVATVKQRIPFPAILGRICPAPCEGPCRRRELDAAVEIKDLKRLVGDHDLQSETPYQPAVTLATGRRVVVVGAGPAGLSAAYYMRQMGHTVTVLDEREQPGGMMRGGPAVEMLPPEVLDGELALVMRGMEFVPGQRLGREVSLEQLRRDFEAVLLACGPMEREQIEALGLETGPRGVHVDKISLQTSLSGVFAAGAIVTPMRLAVRAVGEGYAAAQAMDLYLRGETPRVPPKPWTTRPGKLTERELQAAISPPPQVAETPAERAARCLSCACEAAESCRLRHWATACEALPREYAGTRRESHPRGEHELVVYDEGKCISCGLCVQIARRTGEALGLTYIGRGFEVRVGVPWNETLAAGLEHAAALCAEACPTGALVKRTAGPESRVGVDVPDAPGGESDAQHSS